MQDWSLYNYRVSQAIRILKQGQSTAQEFRNKNSPTGCRSLLIFTNSFQQPFAQGRKYSIDTANSLVTPKILDHIHGIVLQHSNAGIKTGYYSCFEASTQIRDEVMMKASALWCETVTVLILDWSPHQAN